MVKMIVIVIGLVGDVYLLFGVVCMFVVCGYDVVFCMYVLFEVVVCCCGFVFVLVGIVVEYDVVMVNFVLWDLCMLFCMLW